MIKRFSIIAIFSILVFQTATIGALVIQDDFTGGRDERWSFIDDLANIPAEFTIVEDNDADQDLKLIGSAAEFESNFDFSLSTTGYFGLDNDDYHFSNEVHVTATFSPLENITIGGEVDLGNNDVYVVARGDGLSGYIFALDAYHAEADLVRVDEGTVVGLGETAILRDLPNVTQEGTYTLQISAIDNILTGRLFDEAMELLGEVTVEEDTYESGWAGAGAAINDGGDDTLKTLIATSIDDFIASDTTEINVEPVTIDELTAAINEGSTDSRFDIDENGSVDATDRTAWVVNVANSYFGDANLDGEFNSSDFVVVFTAGEYEDEIVGNSLWGEGDWNGDGDFNSGDFVLAFTDGGYEIGPRNSQNVPEPASLITLVIAFFIVTQRNLFCGRKCNAV